MISEQLLLSRQPARWLDILDRHEMRCQALIVSPDLRLHHATRNALKRRGIGALFFSSPDSAMAAFREHRPDVVVVDLSLPGMSAFDLCQSIRSDSLAHTLVIGSAQSSDEAEILLRLGVDSFHRKPMAARRLAALISAALRRCRYMKDGPEERKVIRLGAVEVDLSGYEARINGDVVSLTPTEFRLLCALAERPGQVLTRTWLVDRLWGRDPVEERSVGSYVSRLRKKLNEAGEPNVTIVAVPGQGYALFTQQSA